VARFEELSANSGVDTLQPDNSWVIVPDGGSNQVFLREAAGYALEMKSDGGRVTWKDVPAPPKSHDPENLVASASRGKNDRMLKFVATKPGMGRINAINGGLKVSIGFSVHRQKTHKISFFFLQDKTSDGVKPRTSCSPSDAPGWIKDLNSVFGPQANIWFDPGKAEPLAVAGLGEVVTSADMAKLEDKKDSALINIFLAGSKITSEEADYPLGYYMIKPKLIVVKDQKDQKSNTISLKPMMKTMAHEIAHLLNYHRSIPTNGHDYYTKVGYKSEILNTMDSGDIKIPHQRVLDWNPF